MRPKRKHVRVGRHAAVVAAAAAVGILVIAGHWAMHGGTRSAARRPTPVAADGAAPRRPTLWVLAIGVSRYREAGLSLRFAAADARAVAAAFARQRDGPLYREVKTAVLVDDEVTRGAILRALDEFLGSAAPIDVGVIYLAGHGVHDETLGAYYFLPAAASEAKPQIEGLDMDEFNRQLRMLHRNLRRLVVIVDTCHAGGMAGGAQDARLGQDLAARLPPADGLYVLAAAKAGEQSREMAGHGAFTQALLDGVQGAAADGDGLVRVLGLASYAARAVPQLTGQQQTPYLAIVGADLALAAHPERFAAVTPPPVPTPMVVAAPAARRQRIAIMHFENLRPDPQHDWMQQALGEQLATTFHQLPQFDVYDERMVRFLARGAADPIEASQRADIATLVSGTYWVHNNAISITAHVKRTNPLQALAAAQIDGPLEQFSALSNQIVIDLLEQLHIELSRAELARLQQHRTTDLAARKLLFDAERPVTEPDVPSPTPATRAPEVSLGERLMGLLLPAMSHAADGAALEADLHAVLEGYRQAFEREDVDALARYYTQFTPAQGASLRRYFDNADDLRVEFTDLQIALIGDQAAVSFSRVDHFVDHTSGESQQLVARVTKLFAKGAMGWQIVPER